MKQFCAIYGLVMLAQQLAQCIKHMLSRRINRREAYYIENVRWMIGGRWR